VTRDPLLPADGAATPLSPDERQGLIPSYIALRRELNEAEQRGVLAAEAWAFVRRRPVLDEKFLRTLHKRMFGDVWTWAGSYRRTARNIGVDTWRIPVDLAELLGDTRFRIDHAAYPADEIAARFHHRLVWIHPFPNGNGRHARLASDLLLVSLGRPRFTWGSLGLIAPGATRRAYVESLRAADRHDYEPLMAFVRS